MKKTQRIEIFHLITGTKVAFIAIVIFIILSYAFYLGIGWTGEMTGESISSYMDEHNVRDIELICPYGFPEDQIEVLEEDSEILAIEGSRIDYGQVEVDECRYQTVIRQLTTNVDEFLVKQGTLPVNADEIAIDYVWAENKNIKVGDKIKVYDAKLTNTEFVVTALVCDSAFACSVACLYGISPANHGYIDVQLYCTEDAFALKELGYTDILIRAKDLRGLSYYTSEYKMKCNELKNYFIDEIRKTVGQDVPVSGRVLTALGHVFASESVIRSFGNVKGSLAFIFLLIGFLVCYCTLTRLVYSQSQSIGEMKAYGFRDREIYKRFFMYTGAAFSIGSVLGIVLSVVVEFAIGLADKAIFLFDDIKYIMKLEDILFLVAVEFAGLMLATLISVFSVINKSPMDLLKGIKKEDTTIRFYEKTGWWNRKTFIARTIINNIIRDKRRVISTIIGIASCTALIVTAIILTKNVLDSENRVFSEEVHFDGLLIYDGSVEGAKDGVEELLKAEGFDFVNAYYDYDLINWTDKSVFGLDTIVVRDDTDLQKIAKVEPVVANNPDTGDSCMWLNYAYKNYYGDDAEFTLSLITMEGTEADVELQGYYESHSALNILLGTEDEYRAQFGKAPEYNCFLILNDNINYDDLNKKVGSVNGFVSLQSYHKKVSDIFSTFIGIIMAISGVYFVLAVVMAFLTIYTVLVQFVIDKKKELIIMMLNGYEQSFVNKYVKNDVQILTVIGLIIGGIAGEIIGYFSICSFDTDALYFVRDFSTVALLGGAAVTSFLIWIMTRKVLKNVSKLNLEDISDEA